MGLTQESRQTRWRTLVIAWTIVVALLVPHMLAVRDHLSYVGSLGLRGQPQATTPFTMPYPDGDVDAQEWVQHAYDLLNGHALQLRHTDIDNAPMGREVHWNSAWAWTIAGAGKLQQAVTDEPLPAALEHATIWLNPAVLFLVIVLLSWYTARWAGAVAGAGVAIAMLGHPSFYEGFAPAYVDHHGLLTASILGMMLGALFSGAGWWRDGDDAALLLPRSPDVARRAAGFSALCGAFGVWVSAASTIPPVALVGVAGAATALIAGRDAIKRGLTYDGSVWRIWGRVGGAACVVFYLVEYFPAHLGMRLEVNHPLYALAWWGGGELIAEVTERWVGVRQRSRAAFSARVAGSLVLASLPAVAIVAGGERMFTLNNPFLSYFYHAYLLDFAPIWKLPAFSDLNPWRSVIGIVNLPLLAGMWVVATRRRRAPIAIWFATAATLLFTAMACWQNRWLLNAAPAQICLALVLLLHFTAGATPARRMPVVLGGFAVLFLPGAVLRLTDAREMNRNNELTQFDATMMMYRDIASTLRASQPEGDITLLASENTSMSVGYYGRIKTIASGYWENAAGLEASAEIFAAPTADSAKTLIRARHITHIAIIAADDYTPIYFRWFHPNGTEQELDVCFGREVEDVRTLPAWLELIPYTVPEDLGLNVGKVTLLKVVLDESVALSRTNTAFAELREGDVAGASRDFDALVAQYPNEYAPRLGQSEVLFARGDWKGGTAATLVAITHAPLAVHPALYGHAAATLVRAKQFAHAIQLYHASLHERFDADVAYSLAFLLATSREDSVRNGAEALTLAQRAVAAKPTSSNYAAALAVALAELHRFPEAIAAAQRVISLASAQNDQDMIGVAEQMVAAFQDKQPWRE